VINNVFAKRETKRRESNIDEDHNPWAVIYCVQFSNKGEPIGMINNTHQWNIFIICWARNGSYCCPRWFLDEDNVEIVVDFKNCIYNEIIFSDILWKNLQVFYNHIMLAFTSEQIEFFLVSQSLEYSLECHSLLKQCFQKEQSTESAWWSPLQLRHLNKWEHGLLFLVLSLGGFNLLLALQHQVK